MAKSKGNETNLDSLLDTMTNVVGILVIVLILTQISVGDAVKQIREQEAARKKAETAPAPPPAPAVPTITPEALEEARKERDRIAALLAKLKQVWGDLRADVSRERVDLASLKKSLEDLKKLASEPAPKIPDAAELNSLIAELKVKSDDLEKKVSDAQKELDKQRALLDKAVKDLPRPVAVTLPNPREPPPGATQALFVCKGGRIVRFDLPSLETKFLAEVRRCTGKPGEKVELGLGDPEKIVAHFNANDIGDEYFRLRVEKIGLVLPMRLRFEARRNDQGENSARLAQADSAFAREVAGLDPKRRYVRFSVWSDSFETYLAARKASDERGLAAGWIAFAMDETLDIIIGGGVGGGGRNLVVD